VGGGNDIHGLLLKLLKWEILTSEVLKLLSHTRFQDPQQTYNLFLCRFSGQDAVIGCVGCFLDTNIINHDTTIEKSNRSDGDSGGPPRRHH
jgi:hypothetical protein